MGFTIAPPDLRAVMVPAIGVITFIIHRNARANRQNPFQQKLADVKRDWEALQRAWAAPLPGPGTAEIRAGLSHIKAQHDALPSERAKRLQKLQEQRREKQLEDYLDRFSLIYAKIPGIGPNRVATLARHGIDTASDIVSQRLLAVPGFGQTRVAQLLAWRRSHEAKFRFDPTQGVSPSEIALVERDIAAQRTKLEREVAAGLTRLRAAVVAHTTRRQALEGRAAELLPQYAQALADAAVVLEDRTTHKRLLAMSGAVAVLALVTGVGHRPSSPGHNPPSIANVRPSTPTGTPPAPSPAPAQPVQAVRSAPAERAPQGTETPRQTQPSRTEPVETSTPAAGPPLPQVISPATAALRMGETEHIAMKQAGYVSAAPNGNSTIVRTAPGGAKLRVFSRNAGWVQVGEGEPWGWVYSGLVDPVP